MGGRGQGQLGKEQPAPSGVGTACHRTCLPGWGGATGGGIGDGTRRPAAERMSTMVSTVSNRTALPAFRLVSVLVAT